MAIYDVNDTGPVKVPGLYADTGYGVILQVWRTGGVLKLHATLPALVTLPPTPVTVTATRSDGGDSATVAWTSYGGGDFDYYRVIVCDDTQYDGSSCSGTVFQSRAIYDANDTGPVKVSGLYADTGYGVILQVWRRTGGALKLHATLPPLATPPAAPTGLTAAAGIGSITLSWNDPDDSTITGYEYQLNHTATSTGNLSGWGDWIAIPDSGASTTAYTLTGLESGEEYRFHVRAVNAGGAGTAAPNAYPWYVAATPQAPPALPPLATPPAAPTGLTAAAGIGSIALSWNDPDDSTITGYEYQLNHTATSTGNLSGWGDWIAIPDSGASTTAYTLTGLESGEEYRFHVRAVNAGGAGTAAPNAHPWYVAATPKGAPSAPTGITVDVDLNVMTVGWNAVTGADGYDVRTRTGSADWVVVASAVTATAVAVTILEIPDYTGVRARAGNAASAWTDASRLPPPDIFDPPSGDTGAQAQGGQAQNTLPAPANVQVERWNGGPRATIHSKDYLTIRWDAVAGATGYRIACDWSAGERFGYDSWRKCGKDGSAWKVHGTSAGTDGVTVRYLDGPKDASNTGSWVEMIYGDGSLYSVIVQAVKDGTPGNWSAPVDAYPAYSINWSQKVGNYQELDASSRTASGFTLAWVHPYRGAGYVAECVERVNGKPSGSWTTCGEDTNVFSEKMVDGKAVTVAQAHLYGATASDRIVTGIAIADLDLATAGQQSFDLWKSYDVRVSTLNPSGQSLPTYPPVSITEPYYHLAASNLTASGATLSVTNYTRGWWYERTHPSGDSTCHSVSASPYTASLSSLTPGTPYTYTVYDESGCNAVDEKGSVSFTTPKPAASEVTATSAALSLSNWSAAWWYKSSESNAACTPVAAGTTTVNLGSLTAGTPYTYTTYGKDGCNSADAIGSATFTTPPLAKGRDGGQDFNTLNAADNDSPMGIWSNGATTWVADYLDGKIYAYKTSDGSRDATKDFNTLQAAGNAQPQGIWSNGATIWVADWTDGKLYAYNVATKARDAAKDFNTLQAAGNTRSTGIWSDGATMWVADDTDSKLYAYKMSDGSRDAAKDFNTLQAAGNTKPTGIWSDGATMWVADDTDSKLYAYKMSDGSRDAAKDFNTLQAAGNTKPTGIWSDGATIWVADSDDAKLYAYQLPPRLTASSITDTTATLTLANRTGAWYYQAGSGPDSTCQGPVNEPSQALSGLTGGTSYVYTAYSQSGCSSADAVDTVTFTTASLTAGSLTATTATLTLTGHTSNWWLKQTSPSTGTCTAGEADFSHALSTLTSGTTYTWTAYSKSGCNSADGIGTATFTTVGLTAGSVTLTGATLTLTGHTGNWWLQQTSPSTGTCTAGEADFSHVLGTLTGGTTYTYTAYSKSGCNSADGIVTVTFTTHGLTAGSFTPTGATLRLTGHTGDWWLKQTSPSTGTCTAGEADLSHALDTLTAGTTYTWTAYRDSTCANLIDTVTFTPVHSPGERYAAKDFTTLGAAGNHSPRGLYSDGTTLWMADRDDKKLYAYELSDTSRDAAKDFDTLDAAGNDNPSGIWSDGTTMWVADRDDDKLYAYNVATKARDAAKDFTTLSAAGNQDPYGLWSDGTTMWVADHADGKLYAYQMSDRSRDAGKDFDTLRAAGNWYPTGLWSDGATLWVVDWSDGKLYAYQMSDRSRDAGKDFDTLRAAGNWYPTGLWSDGATLWVADIGSANKLYAYQWLPRLAASGVTDITATLTLTNHTGNWWLKQTAPTAGACTAGEADLSHALGTLTGGTTYTWTAYAKNGCASADAVAAATFTTLAPSLTASAVGDTTTTLTLDGHSGNWWYEADAGPHQTCQGPVSGKTKAVTGLTPGTAYTYSAYSAAACANANLVVAADAFTTGGASVDNRNETGAVTNVCVLSSTAKCATGFTTGEAANGYTLHSLTTRFNIGQANPSTLTIALHTASGGKPATSAVSNATFTVDASATVSRGGSAYTYTHTCAGSGCDLAADTDYFIVTSTTGNYLWEVTSVTSETRVPSTSRWSIANHHLTGANWATSLPNPGKMKLAATIKHTLGVTNLTGNTATLTVVSHDGTAWWYKRTAGTPADGACHSVAAGVLSANLSGLAEHSTYTYKAYDKANCNNADEILSLTFTTAGDGLVASKITHDSAALTLSGHSGDWWLQRATPADTNCAAQSTAKVDLAGLDPGTQYVYKAYNSSTCAAANEIAVETFTTLASLTASDVTHNGATLTVAGHNANWWYKADAGPHTACQGPVSGKTSVTGLTPGTSYTYSAYSATGCAAADLLRTASAFITGGVSTRNLGASVTLDCSVGAVTGANLSCATGFTTGTVASNYTLHSVTLSFAAATGSPAGFQLALHTLSGGVPSSSPRVVLSGSANPATAGDYTYTCSGANCALSANTLYFMVATATSTSGDNHFTWETTSAAAETNVPSNNGWSIANDHRWNDPWQSVARPGLMKVAASAAPTLTATTGTSAASATLNVVDHRQAWWYERVHPAGDSTCHSVTAGTTTASLSSLTAGSLYGYTAYSAAGCSAPELDTVYFTATRYGAGNLAETAAGNCSLGYGGSSAQLCAVPFTTGSRQDGYTLSRVTAAFAASLGVPGNLIVALHAADATNPAATARATLSGANPHTAGFHAFTCSGAGCDLAANTTYFVVLSTADTSGPKVYTLRTTDSDVEGVHPANNGWSIGNTLLTGTGSSWTAHSTGRTGLVHVSARDGVVRLSTSRATTTSATLGIANHGAAWWYERTAPAGDATCHRVAAGATATLSGLTAGTSYTYKAYDESGCNRVDEIASYTFSFGALTAVESARVATLTLPGHSGTWHYKANAAPHLACSPAQTGSARARDLTHGTSYTFKAYADSACSAANLLSTATAVTTAGRSVANVDETAHATVTVTQASPAAVAFTTTGTLSANFKLESVTVSVNGVTGSPTGFTVAIHAAAAGNPAASAAYTLSGSAPTGAGRYVYTCSTCNLTPGTDYFLVLSATGSGASGYTVNVTTSANETAVPANTFSWRIADQAKSRSGGSWQNVVHGSNPATLQVRLSATTPYPGLEATGVTSKAARLTVHGHANAWWYERSAGTPSDTTCRQVSAGTDSVDLAGLIENTAYTYTVYDKANCNSADAIATLTFTTGADGLTAGSITRNAATLTLAGHAANWWVKRLVPAGDDTCKSKGTAGTESLANLAEDKTYVYAAYGNSTCTTEIARETFTTDGLTVNGIDTTAATLNLHGHTGNWYYEADKAPDNACTGPVSGTSQRVTTLTLDTAYVYKAYGDSNCSAAGLLATAGFRTAITVSNLTKAHDGFGPVSSSLKAAGAFTTGRNPGGYTLSYVAVDIGQVAMSPKDLAVSIHSPDNPGALLPNPGARLATLSGTSPTGAGTVTYACTANCGLARGARYFVRLAADGSPDGSSYNWSHTDSFAEDLLPANNGWSLANTYRQFDGSTWRSYTGGHRFKVAATLNPHLSATGIGATSATLNVNDYTGAAWWRKRTLPSGDDTCRSVDEGTTTASLNDLTEYEPYTYTAYDKPGCDSADAIGSVRFTPTDDQLEAGKITDTTATLTLSGHTGNWWLKKHHSPWTPTPSARPSRTTKTEDLTTLTSGVEYTYTAYDANTCGGADAIASATFTTFSPTLTVSNRDETASGSHFQVGWGGITGRLRYAMSFETGAKPGGYTLKSVTVRLGAPTGTAPPALYARIFTITPQSVALVANLGSQSASGAGNVTWTCAGSGCGLDGNTTYFLVLDTDSPTSGPARVFNWSYTASDDETNTPATAGWEIGDGALRRIGADSWTSGGTGAGAFSITADVNPALTVSELKPTTATLNVADRPGTAWWYKRSAGTPADTTCHSVAAGTFKDSLTGLAEYVTYTYTVYDKANCNDADEIAAFTFTTPGDALAVGNLLDDSATLTLTDRAGVWWLKRTTPADATCKSKGTTATESLTGLHPGATYVYKAYSDAACATEIARETFTTLELAAADLTATSATLTLTGHTGNWYYQSSKTPDNSCKGLVATSSQAVSGLTADTGYVYKAHTGRACTSAQRLATLAFRTAVSAGNLAESYTGFANFGDGGDKLAGQFTTGSDAGGYTLASVTVNIHAVTGSPGAPTVSIYSTASNGEPGTSVTTLSGSAPTSAGNHTFTCSANCALEADTDYYVHLAADSATSGDYYSVSITASFDQDLAPSGNGWLLANGYRLYRSNSWSEYGDVLRFRVAAVATPTLSASGVTEDAATLTIVKYTGGAWWHKRTAPPGDTTCHAVAEGTATVSLNGLTGHASHTYRAYDRPGCASADEIDAVTFVATDDVLTAGKLTRTTATLTLTGHTGGWWYKRTAGTPADSTCTSVAAGTKPANLTNLTAGVTYTYKVYDTNGCADADEIASETFTTLARVTVSNRTETATQSGMNTGHLGFLGVARRATSFETGDNELGYTLESVTVSLKGVTGSPTSLSAIIYNDSTGSPGTPGTLFRNLGSRSPTGAGNVTWTCSDAGAGCDLEKETVYHLALEATTTGSSQYYRWNTTSSGNETNTPTGAGWEIANNASMTLSNDTHWSETGGGPGQFSVTASAIGDPFLDARNVTESGATLAMVSYRGAWWYERTAGTPADATCRSVANATTTVTLSGLTMGETYTYKAYDKTGCNSADEIGSDTFTTDGVSVSNLGETLFNSSCVAGRVSGVHTECAQSFTTGSAAGGYTLRRANVRIRSIVNSPGDVRVTLHADSSGSPASTALATLSGANPDDGQQQLRLHLRGLLPGREHDVLDRGGDAQRHAAIPELHAAADQFGRPEAGAERQRLVDWRRGQVPGDRGHEQLLSQRLVRQHERANERVRGRGGLDAPVQRRQHHRHDGDAHPHRPLWRLVVQAHGGDAGGRHLPQRDGGNDLRRSERPDPELVLHLQGVRQGQLQQRGRDRGGDVQHAGRRRQSGQPRRRRRHGGHRREPGRPPPFEPGAGRCAGVTGLAGVSRPAAAPGTRRTPRCRPATSPTSPAPAPATRTSTPHSARPSPSPPAPTPAATSSRPSSRRCARSASPPTWCSPCTWRPALTDRTASRPRRCGRRWRVLRRSPARMRTSPTPAPVPAAASILTPPTSWWRRSPVPAPTPGPTRPLHTCTAKPPSRPIPAGASKPATSHKTAAIGKAGTTGTTPASTSRRCPRTPSRWTTWTGRCTTTPASRPATPAAPSPSPPAPTPRATPSTPLPPALTTPTTRTACWATLW